MAALPATVGGLSVDIPVGTVRRALAIAELSGSDTVSITISLERLYVSLFGNHRVFHPSILYISSIYLCCCLPMTQMPPLVVQQPVSPSIWPEEFLLCFIASWT